MLDFIKDRILNSIYGEFLSNLFGFILIIFSQQIILLPYVSSYNKNIFGDFIIVFTVMNIFSYITGGALGNCFLVKYSDYKKRNIHGDYSIFIILFFIPIAYLSYCFLKLNNVTNSYALIILFLLAAIRLFCSALARCYDKYLVIILQGVFYFVGTVIARWGLTSVNDINILLLIPEILSFFVCIFFHKYYMKDLTMKVTSNFISSFKTFFLFSLQTLLGNVVTYSDRLLIVPLLGRDNLIILFSITVVSKCMAILMNPLKNVILARLAHYSFESREIVFTEVISLVYKIILPIFFFIIIFSYGGLYILYPDTYCSGYRYIPLVAIGSCFASVTSILTAIIMKFCLPQISTYISFLKMTVFFVSAFVLSELYMLWGFIVSIALTEAIIFIVEIYLMKKIVYRNLI